MNSRRRPRSRATWATTCCWMFTAWACSGPPMVPQREIPTVETRNLEVPVAASIERARRAVESSPESGFAWGQLAMTLHAHALLEPAVDCYRTAMELEPSNSRWPYLAGLALQRQDPQESIELLRKAVDLQPGNAAARVDLAGTYLASGEPERAEASYRAALALEPTEPHARLGLARVLASRGEVGAAIELLEEAIASRPSFGDGYAELARLYRLRGDRELAELKELQAKIHPTNTRPFEDAVRAMEMMGASSRAHTDRGLSLVDRGRFSEAVKEFAVAVEIQPESARNHANLGAALARAGQLEEALTAYRKALELAPEDPWTLNNLGLSLSDAGRLQEGLEQIRRSLEADAQSAEAHANLGLVLSRMGRHEEALQALEQALELEPTLVSAQLQLGTVLAELGRLEEAAEQWSQLLDLTPQDPAPRLNLAIAQARLGRHADAIEQLETGIELAPNSSRFARELAWELATAPDADLRDGPRAVRLAERVADAYPRDPAALDVLAAALAETGRFDEAAVHAQRALILDRAQGATNEGDLAARLSRYQSGKPFRQLPPSS